jgi:hypothetical protein
MSRMSVTRRTVLRGAGVAIALPWLESLARPARAQAVSPPKRFLPIFLPNGGGELWKPAGAGLGAAWQLSSVLESLTPLKSKLVVVSGLENGSVFNADGGASVESAHGLLSGAWLTCANAAAVRQKLNLADANGISADQVMAASSVFAGKTPLPSLQVGLSSVQSSCEEQPCSLSRSVSWLNEKTPMYKYVDPGNVFDKLFGAGPGPSPGPGPGQPSERALSRKSVLDAVLSTAAATRGRLSATDKVRMDEFMDSVRSVEKSVGSVSGGNCATPASKPVFPMVSTNYAQDNGVYTKSAHADVMNDLIALAFQCDQTRIISYMLEDERSEYALGSVPLRKFDKLTSTAGVGTCGAWHGAQHGDQDGYASIIHWAVGKVADLCQKLANIPEGAGSVLDNSVVFLGAAMHGADHLANNLPALMIGGGGGSLQTDQHLIFAPRPLRDLYFTLMNGVFGVAQTDFGVNVNNPLIGQLTNILA